MARAALLTHFPEQEWNPVLHVRVQAAPMHLATPFASVGHAPQVTPHIVASSSRAQRAPQRWYPVMQLKSHFWPSQLAWVAPGGTEQGAHDVPQAFTLLFDGHWPLQGCVPTGHAGVQDMVTS